MRISDWSSDVCSSDLVTEFSLVGWWQQNRARPVAPAFADKYQAPRNAQNWQIIKAALETPFPKEQWDDFLRMSPWFENRKHFIANQMKIFRVTGRLAVARSEEHTSELQSLMRISYAVFC